MASRRSFPHAAIAIRDDSDVVVSAAEPMPVHVPIFFIFAEKGPFNVPIWGDTTLHTKIFGEQTFVERSPYFQHPSIFAAETMGRQKCYLVRLKPEDAKLASLVLQVRVEPVQLTQYQKDIDGGRLETPEGAYIPELMPDGTTPVTENGVRLVWSVRPLAADEEFNELEPTTVRVGGVDVTTYPIFASVGESESAAVNRTGYQFYYSTEFDPAQVEIVKAMTYRFAPVQRDLNTGVARPIRNRFDQAFVDVTLAEESLDTGVDRYIDLSEVLATDYVTSDTDIGSYSLLPYKMQVYSAHVEAVAAAVKAVSPELAGLPALQINILSGVDAAGNLYDHCVVAGEGVVPAGGLSSTTTLYHQGGSDGTLTKEVLEALTSTYATGDVYPAIGDVFRYPITHIYDSGYAIQAKKDLLRFWNFRDDVKIDFSTQDVGRKPNTQAEDLSTGASLRTAILLHPESAVEGTQAIRASIYQQCAKRNTTGSYRPYVPMTFARLIKRCTTDCKTYINGTPKTRPYSEVTVFDDKTINWTPAKDDGKQLSWDTGLNYVQYCNTNLLFFPDYRSIYPSETSLLSDDVLVDYLVYLKHIIRDQWTYKSGSNEDLSSLIDSIQKKLDTRIFEVYSTRLNATTTVMQTLLDKQLGYRHTVVVAVKHTPSARVWNVIVPVSRKEA